MVAREVKITVSPEGEFTYFPAVLKITPPDTIVWRCADGPFVVSFGRRGPLLNVEVSSSAERMGDFFITEAQAVETAAPAGVYPYAVAAAVHGRVWLDAHSPTVIIRR